MSIFPDYKKENMKMKKITVEEAIGEIKEVAKKSYNSYGIVPEYNLSECGVYIHIQEQVEKVKGFSSFIISLAVHFDDENAYFITKKILKQECFLNAKTLEEICAAINACTISERYETFSEALEVEPEAALLSMTLSSVEHDMRTSPPVHFNCRCVIIP